MKKKKLLEKIDFIIKEGLSLQDTKEYNSLTKEIDINILLYKSWRAQVLDFINSINSDAYKKEIETIIRTSLSYKNSVNEILSVINGLRTQAINNRLNNCCQNSSEKKTIFLKISENRFFISLLIGSFLSAIPVYHFYNKYILKNELVTQNTYVMKTEVEKNYISKKDLNNQTIAANLSEKDKIDFEEYIFEGNELLNNKIRNFATDKQAIFSYWFSKILGKFINLNLNTNQLTTLFKENDNVNFKINQVLYYLFGLTGITYENIKEKQRIYFEPLKKIFIVPRSSNKYKYFVK